MVTFERDSVYKKVMPVDFTGRCWIIGDGTDVAIVPVFFPFSVFDDGWMNDICAQGGQGVPD